MLRSLVGSEMCIRDSIVDPVLTGDEIKGTAQTYVDRLQNEGCKIVAVDEMGLRQLAYQINRRTTGIYYCIEFQAETGGNIDPMELAMRRDERVMRFLTVRLDKFGVDYNQKKRDGEIGKSKRTKMREQQEAAQKKAQKALTAQNPKPVTNQTPKWVLRALIPVNIN